MCQFSGQVLFQYDPLLIVLVFGQVNQTETTTTDPFDDGVTVDGGTGRQTFSGFPHKRIIVRYGVQGCVERIMIHSLGLSNGTKSAEFAGTSNMTSSMTAFARVQDVATDGELTWEIRSVNHRFLETVVRLPEELRGLDPIVREAVSKRLGRGKIDCSLRYKPAGDAVTGVKVNSRLARQIINSAGEVGKMLHDSSSLGAMDILRWPGVLELEERDLTPLQQRAAGSLEKALDGLVEARKREGARLAELIAQRCVSLRSEVEKVVQLMPVILEAVRDRLHARLSDLTEELDPGRLEQEIALLAQKLDVDEEMDRLTTHITEVESVLKRNGPVGRRLDFLMQELNREANTLTSKSNDVETTRAGVEMKVLIEQMREQIQNIE